jgi:kynureninase
VQALIERGVIGDFRDPDIIRLGLAPLGLRFVDVWDAASALAEVLETGAWEDPALGRRSRVT